MAQKFLARRRERLKKLTSGAGVSSETSRREPPAPKGIAGALAALKASKRAPSTKQQPPQGEPPVEETKEAAKPGLARPKSQYAMFLAAAAAGKPLPVPKSAKARLAATTRRAMLASASARRQTPQRVATVAHMLRPGPQSSRSAPRSGQGRHRLAVHRSLHQIRSRMRAPQMRMVAAPPSINHNHSQSQSRIPQEKRTKPKPKPRGVDLVARALLSQTTAASSGGASSSFRRHNPT